MSVTLLQHLDLAQLPTAENERFEFKASAISTKALKEELTQAASGFWNSGGGIFLAGIDAAGKPDGGVAPTVGRTAIRDWVDQILMEVSPVGPYDVRQFHHDPASALKIAPAMCVLAVGFGESPRPPHMAPNNRYYMRAGAHTVPATHYLVEALWARRKLQRPQLAHTLRLKPEVSGVIQLAVLALTDEPALNVTLSLDPLPNIWKNSKDAFPVVLPVLDRTTPFYLDITTFGNGETQLGQGVKLQVEYEDVAGNHHQYSASVDIKAIAPWSLGTPASERATKSLEAMAGVIKDLPRAIESLRNESADLRGRIEALGWAAFPPRDGDPRKMAAQLGSDEVELLRQAKSEGVVVFSSFHGGVRLAGQALQPTSEMSNRREIAKWRNVISGLCCRGLLDGTFRRGESSVFQLTHLGYDVADVIDEKRESGPGSAQPLND